MQQFTHEEVHIESDIDVRFTIYDSINDYVPEHWHRSMGTTFTAYVNSVRLTHVCRDLKSTDLNIGTILEKHGVTNYKLFMRSFKQIYGCTPKDFRKML